MAENTENSIIVDENGNIKANGLAITAAQLPDFMTKQVDSISQSSSEIDKAIKKAVELDDKAKVLGEKVRLFGKKKAIEDLQGVVKDLVEVMETHCDALISFQSNFEKLSNTSEVLLGLSLVNSAQRNMVIREIKLRLENASKEKLNELAKQELRRVLQQLNAQQELENRVTSLKEKYDALKQQMETVQDDVKKQLEMQNNDVSDRLKESKTQMDGAIQQAKEDLKEQLEAQKKEVVNRLSENEDKFTSFRDDLNTLLNKCVDFEKKMEEHSSAIDEQKSKFDSFFESTTTALTELSERCEKLNKKCKGNGWRYFVSALIGCGFAALAFYILNYIF